MLIGLQGSRSAPAPLEAAGGAASLLSNDFELECVSISAKLKVSDGQDCASAAFVKIGSDYYTTNLLVAFLCQKITHVASYLANSFTLS